MTTNNLLAIARNLPPDDLLVLQFKALIVPDLDKADFLKKVTALIPSVVSKTNSWFFKPTNESLNSLMSKGLLDKNFSCPTEIQHPLMVDIFSTPHGYQLYKKLLDNLPIVGSDRRPYSNYVAQADNNLLRQLRLAIYANDTVASEKLMAMYQEGYDRRIHGPHILEILFLHTPIDATWLNSIAPNIQYHIFEIKLNLFFNTGVAKPDLFPLIEHYRTQESQPGYEDFKWLLFYNDIYAGRTNLTRRKLEALVTEKVAFDKVTYLLVLGSVEFLEGNSAVALEHFRLALKMYRKKTGKRKIFFDSSIYGLFFLLALISCNDPSLYPEIRTYLDAVTHDGKIVAPNFIAIQALLFLLNGQETQARSLLRDYRGSSALPLAHACITLAEFFCDSELAQANSNAIDTHSRFKATKDNLPLIARIHAEVLEKIADKPQPYTDFLNATVGNPPLIRFINIVQLRPSWERTLDSLTNFLKTGSAKLPSTVPVRRSKRLAWFIDLKDKIIEAFEQTPKARDSWSIGRPVAMKRLHEQDPRLDYLTDHDRRVLRTIHKEVVSYHNDEIFYFEYYRTLLALIGHPCVFDAKNRERSVELVAYPVELVVAEQKNGYKFSLSHTATEPTVFLEAETPSRWRVVDFSQKLLTIQNILGHKGLTVPRQGRKRVLELLKEEHPNLPIRADIADADLPAVEGQPAPVLQIQPLEEGLKVTMVVRPFGPSGPYYLAGQGGQSTLAMIDGNRVRVNRDLKIEQELAKTTLTKLPTLQRESAAGHEWIIGDPESAFEFLLEIRDQQPPLAVEWPEGKKLTVHREISARQLALKIDRSRDWFQMEGKIQVDEDLVLDMQDLLKRLDTAQGRFVLLDDGSFLALTRQFQRQLERIRGITEDHAKGGLRLSTFGAVAAQELVEEANTVKADKEWLNFVKRLAAAEKHNPQIPSTLQAELRDYQVEGFKWLSRLAYWQAGACLADDMGLGKTVQAIAVMLEQSTHGPCLVIAPTSVCHNWEHELERFAPTLVVQRLGAASGRAEQIASLKAMDVLVTSYGLLHQEADNLAEVNWQMAVFDEAQAVKNAGTRRAQAGQRIKANFRLALTGTPIENYLDELWSLFSIVNPGLLGSRENFAKRFTIPIERNRNDLALHSLRSLIRPFMLRRTKSAVLSELPPRTELTLEIDLPTEERAFYEAMRRQAIETLAQLRESGTAGQSRIHILAEITRLRRTCCHPALIDPNTQIPGAKLEAFLELVDELLKNRHKALVFSQFVGQLERVRAELVARGISHQYLDGSTPIRDREKRVTAFQSGEGDLFLISLKAGGTGLNLTAADYVIHLDPWWNPAVEDQASDRAHRIGQQRPVTVYRLIVRDSIEEKILAMHRAKRDLASDILEGSEISARLTDDDLLDLIRG